MMVLLWVLLFQINLAYADNGELFSPGALVLVGVCCAGLHFFRITTDPLELWTSPSSQSRINKVRIR